MDLLVLVIALAFVRVWGKDNPLHSDTVVINVLRSFQKLLPPHTENTSVSDQQPTWRALCDKRALGLVSVILLTCSVLFILCLIQGVSQWLVFPFLVALLIYSFGRGDFFDAAFKYAQSCYVDDWQSALTHAHTLGVKTEALFQKDWPTLHKHVFSRVCFCGFDQLFVIIFYFLLLGPVFALFYRLLVLQRETHPTDEATCFILMVLNWPVARLLGFSFALVGNFSGCMAPLISSLKNISEATCDVLSGTALGAFNHTTSMSSHINRKHIESLIQLYKRALWLWFVVIAVAVIAF